MAEQKARLFLGDLPTDTTETDIKRKLQKYGDVASIEIKHKKEIDNVTIVSTFAYVDLNTEKSTLQQCLQDLRHKEWNGSYIKADLAKESFLQRLQREREGSSVNTQKNEKPHVFNTPIKISEKAKAAPLPRKEVALKRKKTYFENENHEEHNIYGEENLVAKLESFSDFWKDDIPAVPTRPFKQGRIERSPKYNNKSSIPSEKLEPFHCSTSTDLPEKEHNAAAKAGEMKRLKAIEERNKAFKEQKDAIKTALSSIDQVKSSKKIVFDDDGTPVLDPLPATHKSNQRFTNHVEKAGRDYIPQRNKEIYERSNGQLQLFGGQDEETDTWQGDFRFKKQFEGKKGKKLLEMQARVKDDDRFVFDERFYESDEEAEHSEKAPETAGTAEEKDLLEEKAKELEILANVLGEPVQPTVPKKSAFSAMVRFDPLKPSHAKFELPKVINAGQKAKDADKKGQAGESNEEDKSFDPIEDEVLPVDETQFYQVANNLKDLFKKDEKNPQVTESSTFSLRQMFSSTTVNEEREEKEVDDNANKKSAGSDEQKPREMKKTFLLGFQNSKPLAMFSKKLLGSEPESGCNMFCKGLDVEAIKEKFSEKRRVLGRMLHKKKVVLERQQHFKQKIGVASAAHNKSLALKRKQSNFRGGSRNRK